MYIYIYKGNVSRNDDCRFVRRPTVQKSDGVSCRLPTFEDSHCLNLHYYPPSTSQHINTYCLVQINII